MFFLGDVLNKKLKMPRQEEALPGRPGPIATADNHYVFDRALAAPAAEGIDTAYFGMGCFWGAERLFWQTPGVVMTAVGYGGGFTPNPTYQETCTGLTGHAEIVKVDYDPKIVSFDELLRIFWENHDPTQGMRQGNDVGTTYRSAIYTTGKAQFEAATASRTAYEAALAERGLGPVTTEIKPAEPFYYAEEDHQQYLAKNPSGYCGLKGTGVACAGAPAPA